MKFSIKMPNTPWGWVATILVMLIVGVMYVATVVIIGSGFLIAIPFIALFCLALWAGEEIGRHRVRVRRRRSRAR